MFTSADNALYHVAPTTMLHCGADVSLFLEKLFANQFL